MKNYCFTVMEKNYKLRKYFIILTLKKSNFLKKKAKCGFS